MQNPIRATGEAMSGISRRTLLTSAAAAAVTVPTIGVAAKIDPISQEVGDLLEKWCALETEAAAIRDRYWSARQSVPDWAKPGRQFVRSDGTLCGAVVGFPEVAKWAPPKDPMLTVQIRPSLKDVLRHYEFWMPQKACPARAMHRRAAFAAARRWIARCREQQAAEDAAGLREIERQGDANGEAMQSVVRRLEAMGEDGGNLDLVAAHLFIELKTNEAFGAHAEDLEWAEELHMRVLRIVSSRTTGKVRSIVTEALASAGRVS